MCFVMCTEFVFFSTMLMINTVNWVFCKQKGNDVCIFFNLR
uniref:Alternative protein ST18 n=1 Tax=Homo sapiens TaxID=9606 RepID=L8E831_HUMAN|nr:alternative protein ST18 [Homo sapiens]